MSFPLPAHNAPVLDFLANRRSNLAKSMGEPGPSDAQLQEILQIGTRVPDHRKLSPWRIVVYRGAARDAFGQALQAAYRADNPDHPEDRHRFEADRFLRAPVVLAVISAPIQCVRGTPRWEQELSVGAVCLKLCLAAQASGFGAQWLTEWYAYDDRIAATMGLAASERIAGFIYIGTPSEAASPRARPDLSQIVSYA